MCVYIYTCITFLFVLIVKEKLTADPDSEIATTSLRVSLMCPVSRAGNSQITDSYFHLKCRIGLLFKGLALETSLALYFINKPR